MRGQLVKDQMKTTEIITFKGHSNKRRIKWTNKWTSQLPDMVFSCRCWGIACKRQNGRVTRALKSPCVNGINTQNLLWQQTWEIMFPLCHRNFRSHSCHSASRGTSSRAPPAGLLTPGKGVWAPQRHWTSPHGHCNPVQSWPFCCSATAKTANSVSDRAVRDSSERFNELRGLTEEQEGFFLLSGWFISNCIY